MNKNNRMQHDQCMPDSMLAQRATMHSV